MAVWKSTITKKKLWINASSALLHEKRTPCGIILFLIATLSNVICNGKNFPSRKTQLSHDLKPRAVLTDNYPGVFEHQETKELFLRILQLFAIFDYNKSLENLHRQN